MRVCVCVCVSLSLSLSLSPPCLFVFKKERNTFIYIYIYIGYVFLLFLPWIASSSVPSTVCGGVGVGVRDKQTDRQRQRETERRRITIFASIDIDTYSLLMSLDRLKLRFCQNNTQQTFQVLLVVHNDVCYEEGKTNSDISSNCRESLIAHAPFYNVDSIRLFSSSTDIAFRFFVTRLSCGRLHGLS